MIFLFLGLTLSVVLEIGPLLASHSKRDMIAFAALFCLALTMAILFAVGVKLPSSLALLGKLAVSLGITY